MSIVVGARCLCCQCSSSRQDKEPGELGNQAQVSSSKLLRHPWWRNGGSVSSAGLVRCPYTATTCKSWFIKLETLSCTVWGCYCDCKHPTSPTSKSSETLNHCRYCSKYVSDSWKHSWEELAPLLRAQQLLSPATKVYNLRGEAPRFIVLANEYSAVWCIHQFHKLK